MTSSKSRIPRQEMESSAAKSWQKINLNLRHIMLGVSNTHANKRIKQPQQQQQHPERIECWEWKRGTETGGNWELCCKCNGERLASKTVRRYKLHSEIYNCIIPTFRERSVLHNKRRKCVYYTQCAFLTNHYFACNAKLCNFPYVQLKNILSNNLKKKLRMMQF